MSKEVKGVIKLYADSFSALLILNTADVDVTEKEPVAQDLGLDPKNEFHITVIGYKQGKVILEKLKEKSQSERDSVQREIIKILKGIEWHIILENKYFLIRKNYADHEQRQTIIQLATIAELEGFYHDLNALLQTDLLPQFPHLTTFSNSTNMNNRLEGIAINSQAQFEELVVRQI